MKTIFEIGSFIALFLAVAIYYFNEDGGAAAYAIGMAIYLKLTANGCKEKE